MFDLNVDKYSTFNIYYIFYLNSIIKRKYYQKIFCEVLVSIFNIISYFNETRNSNSVDLFIIYSSSKFIIYVLKDNYRPLGRYGISDI